MKLKLIAAAVVLPLIGLGAFRCWWTTRPLPFDRTAWQAATASDYHPRLQMGDAVLTMLNEDDLTYGHVIARLGPPDRHAPASLEPGASASYHLGTKRTLLCLPQSQMYLHITLNEEMKVLVARIAPE